jgi:hypothetical protein
MFQTLVILPAITIMQDLLHKSKSSLLANFLSQVKRGMGVPYPALQ